MKAATFRFYGPLKYFLPEDRKRKDIIHPFSGNPAVKDRIESLGVPHPEVYLILIDGQSAYFSHQLQGGERISVYPYLYRLDPMPEMLVREEHRGKPAFVVDSHLGRLVRYLRMLGFDCLFVNDQNHDPVCLAIEEKRILLSGNLRLLKRKELVYAYYVRSNDPEEQLREVVERYSLAQYFEPFGRCLLCNGRLRPVDKSEVIHRLEPLTKKYYHEFYFCSNCEQVFWKGSHFKRMQEMIEGYRTI